MMMMMMMMMMNRVRFLLEDINPLNAKLNPIRPLLAFFGAHHILQVSR